jgi:D-3-phosphoglycerate dehydrogenase
VIKRHEINVEELSNTIFDGAEAACAKMRLAVRPSDACLSEMTSIADVLHVNLAPLPEEPRRSSLPPEPGAQKIAPRSVRP